MILVLAVFTIATMGGFEYVIAKRRRRPELAGTWKDHGADGQ